MELGGGRDALQLDDPGGPPSRNGRGRRRGGIVSPPVWPGEVGVSAEIADKEWRLTAIRVGERQLGSGDTVECMPGELVDSLQIVIDTNLGVVAGRVVSPDDKSPREGAWVHPRREDGELIHIPPVETDRTGGFIIHSVPAGPYTVAVSSSFITDVHEPSRREIRIAPGEVIHLDLLLPKD